MEFMYNSWLNEYRFLVRELDLLYKSPDYRGQKYIKGRDLLYDIIDELTKNRKITCKEIAESQIRKKRKRTDKSVIDNVRKFIQNNLVPRRIVQEDGYKIIHNRKEQCFSLTPFGILYAIHLNIENVIENISLTYKETLPKVFGEYEFFKSIFGKIIIGILGIKILADTGRPKPTFSAARILGWDFLDDSGIARRDDPTLYFGRWTNQISLAVYCNILDHYGWKAEHEHRRTGVGFQSIYDKKIKEFWDEMDKHNPAIKSWFKDYVNEVTYKISENKKLILSAKSWFK